MEVVEEEEDFLGICGGKGVHDKGAHNKTNQRDTQGMSCMGRVGDVWVGSYRERRGCVKER